MTEKQKQNIKNILIIKLSSIGDCLLATPAIESIRRAYPESFITWLIEDKSKDIALLNPNINKVIVIDKKNYRLKDYLKLIAALKSDKYDMSVDLQGVDRTSLFAFLSGAKERYVEEYANLGFLSNKKINRKGRKPEHAVKFYLYLAESSGGAVLDSIKPIFKTDKADEEFANKFISEKFSSANNTVKKTLFVGINPGGAWATKKWPAGYFAKLSELILRKYDARIVIFGGKEDETSAKNIISILRSNFTDASAASSTADTVSELIADATGQTTLMQAKELIAKMDYFITGDSGLMHIAASVENGPEIISLFGPTSAELTGPIGDNIKIFKSGLICSPCFKKSCILADKKEGKKELNYVQTNAKSAAALNNVNVNVSYANANAGVSSDAGGNSGAADVNDGNNDDNNGSIDANYVNNINKINKVFDSGINKLNLNIELNANSETYALCMKKICVSDVFKLISDKQDKQNGNAR
jgi:lipopolysaccharide heptosyltransferase II